MLTVETLQLLQQNDTVKQLNRALQSASAEQPVITIPAGFQNVDIESYMPHRRSFRGEFSTNEVDSFVGFCRKHGSKHSVTFVRTTHDSSNHTLRARTIFDYAVELETAPAGSTSAPIEKPGHCGFVATLSPRIDPEFEMLLDIEQKVLTQEELANLLTDYVGFTATDDDGKPIVRTDAIAAIRRVTKNAMSSITTTSTNLSEARSSFESVEAKADAGLVMPTTLKDVVNTFDGLNVRTVSLRLITKFDGDKPIFRVKIIKPNELWEAIEKEFANAITFQLTGIIEHVFVGNFST